MSVSDEEQVQETEFDIIEVELSDGEVERIEVPVGMIDKMTSQAALLGLSFDDYFSAYVLEPYINKVLEDDVSEESVSLTDS